MSFSIKKDEERVFDARTRNALKFALIVHAALAAIIMVSDGSYTRQVYSSQQHLPVEIVSLDKGDASFPDPERTLAPVKSPIKEQTEKKITRSKKSKAKRKYIKRAKKRIQRARKNQIATSLPPKRIRRHSGRSIKLDFEKPDHETEAGDHFTTRELAKLKKQEEAYQLYQQRLRQLQLQQNGG